MWLSDLVSSTLKRWGLDYRPLGYLLSWVSTSLIILNSWVLTVCQTPQPTPCTDSLLSLENTTWLLCIYYAPFTNESKWSGCMWGVAKKVTSAINEWKSTSRLVVAVDDTEENADLLHVGKLVLSQGQRRVSRRLAKCDVAPRKIAEHIVWTVAPGSLEGTVAPFEK